jgi:hypothetical protein
MMLLPERLPVLASGKQSPGSGRVCSEQAVNWLVSGRVDLGDETDRPECVQPVLNALAIAVNDRVSDAERQRMWPIILRQPGTARPEMEPVLSVRLAAFLAEQVLDLVRPGDRQACREAIKAARDWADCPCDRHANDASAASAAYYAANVAAAAAAAYNANDASAASAAYYAANVAAAAAAASAGRDPIALLAAAQDECERLTGHSPPAPDIARIERLAELVGSA